MDQQLLVALEDVRREGQVTNRTLSVLVSQLADIAQMMRTAFPGDPMYAATQAPGPPQPFEGVSRHAFDAEGRNYFRYELPGKRWLLVRTDADLLVEEVQVEDSLGERVSYTLEEVIEQFGDLPMFNLHLRDHAAATHPTDRSLNPDVEP